MKNKLKKLIAAVTGLLAPLTLALPAYAQISTCPEGDFNVVCSLQASDFGKLVSNILTALFIIAIVVALIFLVWGGIKWIVSGGDKAKVEAARNTIIGGIVGLVLVFLAYFIVSLVAGLFGIDIQNMSLPQLLGA